MFRVFILLASSDSDKHNYVNEAKCVNKDSPRKTTRDCFQANNGEYGNEDFLNFLLTTLTKSLRTSPETRFRLIASV